MSLTKKQLKQLEGILYDINRAYNYLNKPDITGIAQSITDIQSGGADYTINNIACLESCSNTVKNIRVMNKNIGSDITGLSFAKNRLTEFINQNSI